MFFWEGCQEELALFEDNSTVASHRQLFLLESTVCSVFPWKATAYPNRCHQANINAVDLLLSALLAFDDLNEKHVIFRHHSLWSGFRVLTLLNPYFWLIVPSYLPQNVPNAIDILLTSGEKFLHSRQRQTPFNYLS
jgi:hypothetical protein